MSDLYELTAMEIVNKTTSRELSVRTLVDALLERIAEFDCELQAWVTVDADRVREEADRLDRLASQGRFAPLHGVPVGVKDIIDVAGLPTIAGFEPFRGRAIDRDAEIIRRLRAAGAIILGKTHTTQFANGDPAPTLNPWNREKTPGGSSSGSGAAVAGRMTPLALGTQTVGSTLRPAAYCGVAAFKPSFNWMERDGVIPLAWSLDHLGLIARSVADLALVYGVLVNGRAVSLSRSRPPRLAYLKALTQLAEPAVMDHLNNVVENLRSAGATVEEVELPVEFELIQAVHFVIMQAEASAIHGELREEHPDEYGPSISRTVDIGSLIPAPFDVKARRLRRQIRLRIDQFITGYDGFILPTAFNVAPISRTTGDNRGQGPWTLLGMPAISLATGLSEDSLPIGTQLVGRRGNDADLLAVAAWCEQVLGTIGAPDLNDLVPQPEPEPEMEQESVEPVDKEAEERRRSIISKVICGGVARPGARVAAGPGADFVTRREGQRSSVSGGVSRPGEMVHIPRVE